MTEIKLGKKKYQIYFAMQPTIQSGLLPRIAETENTEEWGIENVDVIFTTAAEMLLIALQKNYKEEFGYNYQTGEGKDEAIAKVYDLLDDYSQEEDADFFALYNALEGELLENSFFAKMFRQEVEKAKAETEQNSEK